MKKSLYLWQLAGFLFTGIAGTLLHFAYDRSGRNLFFALFSAINVSIREHMKLLFFPMFAFALLEYRFVGDQYSNFWCAKLAGIPPHIPLFQDPVAEGYGIQKGL